MIVFSCGLHKTSMDKEGQKTVVLKVPSSDKNTISELEKWTEKELRVSIDVVETKTYGAGK